MKRDTRRDPSGEEHTIEPESRSAAKLLLKAEPDATRYDNMSTGMIVASCAKTYGDEVARLTLLGALDTTEVKRKASDLWRAVLPDLVDHRTTLAYIACIAWGNKMQLLSPADTKAMMFMAQTQLTVLRGMEEARRAAMPRDVQRPAEGELFMSMEVRQPQNSMEPKA